MNSKLLYNYQDTLRKSNKDNNNDNNNDKNINISTILLGLGLLGGLTAWYYYPNLFNGDDKKIAAKKMKLKRTAKKFKEILKKPNEMLKICKTTLNNNIIVYNDYKRDLNKLGSQLQVIIGEEVRTPYGRGIVKQWREEDSMVEITLIWNASLITKPLGLSNVTNNISGESGVESSSYYFFRSDGIKVKNKWDSYDIDAELRKLDENDGDEEEMDNNKNKKTLQQQNKYNNNAGGGIKLKPAKKVLTCLQKLKIKLERLQLKIDSIAIDSMTIGKPPNEKMTALYQTTRKRRKLLINNIENILIELETKVKFAERIVNVLC